MLNYERNRRYFFPGTPLLAYFLFFISIFTITVSVASIVTEIEFHNFLLIQIGLLIIGLLCILLGVFSYYSYKRKIPTDTEIDNVCKGRVYQALTQGLLKIGISPTDVNRAQPIVIGGYFFQKILTKSYSKVGEDGVRRSSNYQCLILYLSEKQVFVYNLKFSLITPEITESTEEYFYQDIVTISTSTQYVELSDHLRLVGFQKDFFQLITTGGNSLTCPIDDLSSIETSLHQLKQFVRQRKNQGR